MRILSSIVLVGGLAMGSFAYAQDPPRTPPQTPPPAEKSGDASKVSLTGCLTKGATAGEYSITDQKSGEKVSFSAPAQLEKFLNQTVRLTGTQGQDKAFKPESVNQVAASCEKSQ
jgi:hypothetical protein